MDTIFVNETVILPSKIKVRIFKGESGAWIAELPEFDISTEADSYYLLGDMVNDLIYIYFDVPVEYRNSIRYVPIDTKKAADEQSKRATPVYYQKFISSDAIRLIK